MDNISYCEFCNKLTISTNTMTHLGGGGNFTVSRCAECGKVKQATL